MEAFDLLLCKFSLAAVVLSFGAGGVLVLGRGVTAPPLVPSSVTVPGWMMENQGQAEDGLVPPL